MGTLEMPDLTFCESNLLIDEERVDKKYLKGWDKTEYNRFKKNKSKVNPIYLEKDIEYSFNQHGYRTKDIKDLDKDFVLVFGCSHTEGVGNFEEDIWCSQLLNAKGIDFLNLGKGGSGPDIQYLNTLQWIRNDFLTPSLVIYQWPQTFRKSFSYIYNNHIYLKNHNVHNEVEKKDTDWYLKRYCVELGEMYLNNYVHYHSANFLWQSIHVPVLNWSWEGDFECEFENLHIIKTEDTGRARDLMHDGPDIHKQVADQLFPLVDKLI
jgi:hypothetical protein